MREAAALLLDWYGANARALPWRVPPGGGAADPYRVWLSEVMLQQTTVAAVAPRYAAWLDRWPTVEALATASEAEVCAAWAGLGYYARARNLAAAARAVVASGGFPNDEAALRALPGIGEYTAAAVAAIAFGRASVPIDANIARVGARLFAADLPPAALKAGLAPMFASRAGDVAQALMDVGSAICTPRAPMCGACPLAPACAAAACGTPERWPARKAKLARPVRRGVAFWLECEGAVLTVRRPTRGLLGGMRALPSSAWGETLDDDDALAAAPAPAAWRIVPTRVAHTFTHFHLDLGIAAARTARRPSLDGEWIAADALDRAGLPTLFRKVAHAARADTAAPRLALAA